MNDIDNLNAAMLNIIEGVEKMMNILEILDSRIKKLESAKPPVFYPQYSPNEWPQPIKWNYPEYPITRWNVAYGIKNANSN